MPEQSIETVCFDPNRIYPTFHSIQYQVRSHSAQDGVILKHALRMHYYSSGDSGNSVYIVQVSATATIINYCPS